MNHLDQIEDTYTLMNYNTVNKYKRNTYSKKTKKQITRPKRVCETVNYHKQQTIDDSNVDDNDDNDECDVIESQYYDQLERELYFRRKELFN